jgi:anaerobic selenocysteine-containing dehydrogenase
VHISHQAIEPPGQARSDFDIFLDFARRMDFRDQDGAPLVKWRTPEECFEAWKECTRGRPCDYTGLSWAKLTGGGGIQWPCNEKAPDGSRRIYTDLVFHTAVNDCETFAGDAAKRLQPFVEKYGKRREGEPERLDEALLRRRAPSPFNLVRDLHDLWLLVNETLISVDILEQAGHALRDDELLQVLAKLRESNQRQRDWLRTRLRQAAPQVLVVPS